MRSWRHRVTSAAIVLWAAGMMGCSPRADPAQDTGAEARGARPTVPPAAPVPTHLLTLEKAGSTTSAEQGDLIEIRLDEEAGSGGTWRLTRQSGHGRVEARGEPVREDAKTGFQRVFRFRTVGIGDLELAFAFHAATEEPKSGQTATFRLVIR